MHIRTVTSGLIAMSAHVEVTGTDDWHDVLEHTNALLRDRFGIAHATLQPEEPHPHGDAFRGCTLDTPEGQNACRTALRSSLHAQHEL
jgi:cobalt-zinc-cadmium efflux system protein